MKYKEGNRVRIKTLDWYKENKDEDGNIRYQVIDSAHPIFFTKYMSRFCGETLTIICVHKGLYHMNETGYSEFWTDEMIEGLVEEETLIERVDDNGLPFNEWLSHKGAFYIPDGYELKDENGNIINATKIVLEKKKKEYPKTFRKCCEILDIDSGCLLASYDIGLWKDELLGSLQKLLICRDAYWKIAGEEMGLGKPWEPNDADYVTGRYCIFVHRGNIICSTPAQDCILTFPTEEMRDAFYENFDPDIEICKELL